MQSTNSEYGLPYLVVSHVTLIFFVLLFLNIHFNLNCCKKKE